MKRYHPDRRRFLIRQAIGDLYQEWTCRHGEWNRNKMLEELERELKARRREGNYGNHRQAARGPQELPGV